MVTGIQIKMARAALGWSVRELGQRAGVNPNTITRIEGGADALAGTLQKLEEVLREGVDFIDENGGGAGVRLKAARK